MADGTRLSIDLSSGTILVEGDADLAREVYRDFRDRLAEHRPAEPEPAEPAYDGGAEQAASTASKGKKPSSKKRASKASTSQKGTADAQIKPDPDLDLKGLGEFYDQYEPKNNAEKVLIFASFLRDRLGKEPFTANDVYTCYWTLKDRTKTPTAFGQTLRNIQSRQRYIALNTLDDIRITTAGNNHLHHGLKRVVAE